MDGCGTRIVWVDQSEGWRFPNYAWRDASIPPLEGFQSEAYVCGEQPPHYPVPSTYVESEIVGALWQLSREI